MKLKTVDSSNARKGLVHVRAKFHNLATNALRKFARAWPGDYCNNCTGIGASNHRVEEHTPYCPSSSGDIIAK